MKEANSIARLVKEISLAELGMKLDLQDRQNAIDHARLVNKFDGLAKDLGAHSTLTPRVAKE